MKTSIQYLISVFNSEIVIESTNFDDKPLYFRKKYLCQFFTIDDVQYVLIEHNEKTQLIIESLKNELIQIKKLTKRLPVFVFKGLRLVQRNTLIQNKIPFIVPNKQIFIPKVMMNLSESEAPRLNDSEKFVKSTQVAFAYLLLHPIDEINGHKLASLLGFSPNTASRVLNELADKGILYREGSNTRKKYLMPDKRTYWDNGKKHLFNPITNTLLLAKNKVNFESGLLYRSYETAVYALSEDFDEDSLRTLSYACAGNKLDLATNDSHPILSTMSFKDLANIQCLAYDPGLLSDTDTVDIVTLYAQFIDSTDERIRIALDELVEEVING